MKLIITRGLPGCGKSTKARAWVSVDRANRSRVNRDDLREMMDEGVFVKGVTEGRILAARDALIRGLLRKGQDVVCDDTNLPQRTARDLMRIAKQMGADFEVWDMTFVDLDTCLVRDAARTDKAPVGAPVILDMYNRFIKGRQHPIPVPEDPAESVPEVEPYEPVAGMYRAIVVDVDGTVALKGTRDPFDETRISEDMPNAAVIDMVQMYEAAGYKIVFCSGRHEGCREDTYIWLCKNVCQPDALFMRADNDGRPDYKVKLDLFNENIRWNYNVKFVLDDRDQVVKLWRSLGLTCLQVAEGNF